MKSRKFIYYLAIFFVTLLTYEQHLGLNAFLIPAFIVGITYFTNKSVLSKRWAFASGLWLLSGAGICLWHLDIGLLLFFVSGLHFFSVNYHSRISLPISILQSSISFFTGIIRFFNFKIRTEEFKSVGESSQKIIRKLLLISIPFVLFTIFLKLYQIANPKFEELTSFINLNFIEIPFFIHLGTLAVLCFGLFFFKPYEKVLEIDLAKVDHIDRKKSDLTAHSDSLQLEWQLGKVIVTSLSLLLFAFILVDFQTIFSDRPSELSHSQNVHQGINVLIGSIILVIIIILYFFRGRLNFMPSNFLRISTYFWLILNGLVVFLIVIKNNQYIINWGLTHKRIGVYIYLSLCIIGLLFTVLKIRYKWFTIILIERVSNSFLTILVVFGLFNWNGIIVRYNLNENHLPADKVDIYYLAKLGPEAYVPIINYINSHPEQGYSVESILNYRIHNLNMAYSKDWSHFLSYTYGGYKAYQITKDYDYHLSYSNPKF